jgi:hypothetical protein
VILDFKSSRGCPGEPFAETIRGVTVGHQFQFAEKLAFLRVKTSFALLETSGGLESFVQYFLAKGLSTGSRRLAALLIGLHSVFAATPQSVTKPIVSNKGSVWGTVTDSHRYSPMSAA